MADRLEFDVSLNGNEAQSLIRTLADDLAKAGKSFNESVDFSTAAQQAKSVVDALDFSTATDQLRSLGDALDPQAASNFADAVKGAADSSAVIGNNLDPTQAAALTDEIGKADSHAGNLATDTASAAVSLLDAAGVSGDVATSLGDAAGAANEADNAFANMAQSSGESANKIHRSKEEQAGHNEKLSEANLLMEQLKEKLAATSEKGAEVFGPLGHFVEKAIGDIQGIETAFGTVGLGATAGAATFLVAGEEWANISGQIARSTGATGEALGGMTESFDKILAVSNRAPQEIAQTFSTLSGDLGISGTVLEEATKKTESFLQATGANAGSVRTLTQDMVQMGVGAEGLGGFLDNVTAASTHFGVSADRLLSEVKQVGSGFQALGLSQSESVGMIAMFDRAGINVNRLSSGLTKIEQQANSEGITGKEKLQQLFDNVTHAQTATEGLNAVQGIWSGRTAQQVVAALQSHKIGFDELNTAMSDAPGKTEAVAKATETLGTVFTGLKDSFLAAIGPFGHEMAESLKGGIEAVKPAFTALFDVLKALGPVFKGLMETGLGPIGIALQVATPALHLLVSVLNLIPDPIKAAVGAFIALKVAMNINFISGMVNGMKDLVIVTKELVAEEGIASVTKQTGGLAASIGKSAGQGILGAVTSLNPVMIAATVGIGAFEIYSHRAKQKAEEFAKGVDALTKTLGDLSIYAPEAGRKLVTALELGSSGGVISDKTRQEILDLGITITQFEEAAIAKSKDPHFDILGSLVKNLDSGKQGIAQFIIATDSLDAKDKQRLLNLAEQADGEKKVRDELDATTATQGDLLSFDQDRANWLKESAGHVVELEKTVTEQLDKSAQARLKDFKAREDGNIAIVDEVLQTHHWINEVGHANQVLDESRIKRGELALATEGITIADEKTAQKAGAFVAQLQASKSTVEDLAKAEQVRIDVVNSLIKAEIDHKVTTKDLAQAYLDSGASAAEVTAALKDLQTIESNLGLTNEKLGVATEIFFQDLSRGMDPMAALADASHRAGIEAKELSGQLGSVKKSMQDLFEPFKASDEVMSAIVRDFQDGAGWAGALADATNLLGGDSVKAGELLKQYKKDVDDAAKSIKEMTPNLADLNKQATNPSKGTSSLKVWEDETSAVEANTAARILNVDTAIARTKGSKDDLLAADPNADTSFLDARIAALKVDRDKLVESGKEAVKGVRDSMNEAAKEVPGSLARIIDDGMAAAATRFNDAKTVEEITRAGGTNLLKVIFDPASAFSPAERSKMLAEASHMSPEEFMAQEARAKTMYEGQKTADEEAIKAGEGLAGVFKGVNPLFIKQSQEEGKANGMALVAGIAGGMAEAAKDGRLTKLIQALLRGGLTSEMVQQMFPEFFPKPKVDTTPPNTALRAEQAGGDVNVGPGGVGGADLANLHQHGEDAGGDYARGFRVGVTKAPLTPNEVKRLAGGEDVQGGHVNVHRFGEDAGADYSEGFKGAAAKVTLTPSESQALTDTWGVTWTNVGEVSGQQMHDELVKQIGMPIDPVGFSNLVSAVIPVAKAMGITVGEAFRDGTAAGILKGQNATEAAFRMANGAVSGADAAFAAKSPSRVMMQRGQWFVEGLAQGIEAHAPKAHAAATKMTDALTGIIGGTMGSPKILAQLAGGPVSLGDGPGVDRIVRAINGSGATPSGRGRRRQPFGGA